MTDLDWVVVANIDDMPIGEIQEVLVAGGVIAIVRTSSGAYAFDNNCAHMGVSLSQGRIEGDTVICPLHNWSYDLRAATMGYPSPGRPFTTFPTKILNGQLLVWPSPKTWLE